MIRVEKIVRQMRGTSRAVHAVASNGWHYVVKPPMIGLQALINEWLGARLMRMVGVMAPDVEPILIPAPLAKEAWPDAIIGGDLIGVASAYPVDPTKHAVYDFIPDSFVDKVANKEHFVGALALDLWVGKNDPRHTVYYRQGPFWACFVDNKNLFGAVRWGDLHVADVANPVASSVYRRVLDEAQIDMWTAKIWAIRPAALKRQFSLIPACWEDTTITRALAEIADLLLSRRSIVPVVLRDMARARTAMLQKNLTCAKMAPSTPCP